MLIYLLRHGEAEKPDPDKPKSLTDRGKAEVVRVCAALAQKKVRVDVLWHSPKKRAVQTARILQEALGLSDKCMEEKDELKPNGDVEEVHRQVLAQKARSLMIVSHLPFLPDLAVALTGKGAAPVFPTGGLAAFEGDKTFKLLWTLSPRDLG
jgi:phosphohistidine phosphatase